MSLFYIKEVTLSYKFCFFLLPCGTLGGIYRPGPNLNDLLLKDAAVLDYTH